MGNPDTFGTYERDGLAGIGHINRQVQMLQNRCLTIIGNNRQTVDIAE